jgi:hypothetical protein
MKTSEHERKDVPREQTPRGEDPARLNDLNADKSTDTARGLEDENSKQGTPSQRPTLAQAERDGEIQRPEANPSFVESGVSDGGQEGEYGKDSYKGRRNEKPKSEN